eukprot:EG_transcript_6691
MTTISRPFLKCCRCHRLVFEGLQAVLGPARLYHGLYTVCEFLCPTCGEDGPALRRTGRTVKDVLRTVLLDQSVRTGKRWHNHQSLQKLIEEDWDGLFGSALKLDDNWPTQCAAAALTSRDTFQRKGHAIRLVNVGQHYPEYAGVALQDNAAALEALPPPIAGSNRSTEAEPSRSSSEGDLKPPQPEGLDPLERKPVSIRLKRSSNAVAVAVPPTGGPAAEAEPALQLSPPSPVLSPATPADSDGDGSEAALPLRSKRRRSSAVVPAEAPAAGRVEHSALEFDEEEDRPRFRKVPVKQPPEPQPAQPSVPVSVPTIQLPSADFTPTAEQITAELDRMRHATQTRSTLQLLKHFQAVARYDLSFSLLHTRQRLFRFWTCFVSFIESVANESVSQIFRTAIS